jgi:hypothetical protein
MTRFKQTEAIIEMVFVKLVESLCTVCGYSEPTFSKIFLVPCVPPFSECLSVKQALLSQGNDTQCQWLIARIAKVHSATSRVVASLFRCRLCQHQYRDFYKYACALHAHACVRACADSC